MRSRDAHRRRMSVSVISKHVLLLYSTYFVLAAIFISFDFVFHLPVPVFVECVSACMVI